MTDRLKDIFGPKCTSVKVNDNVNIIEPLPGSTKLCEAVKYSFDRPICINNDNLGCPGARRCVGFDFNDDTLASFISDESRISLPFIKKALVNISCLTGVTCITLGLTETMERVSHPDLFIIYTRPAMITKVTFELARMNSVPFVSPYMFQSVCGNVLAYCYANHAACISFGCPDSRKSGGIGDDEVILGLPYNMAETIINAVTVSKH